MPEPTEAVCPPDAGPARYCAKHQTWDFCGGPVKVVNRPGHPQPSSGARIAEKPKPVARKPTAARKAVKGRKR
jgi:hypothetical protein